MMTRFKSSKREKFLSRYEEREWAILVDTLAGTSVALHNPAHSDRSHASQPSYCSQRRRRAFILSRDLEHIVERRAAVFAETCQERRQPTRTAK